MKIKFTILLASFALALTLAFTHTAPAAPNAAASPAEPHPHIRAAIHELREARNELKTAAHDFGGHRDEALEATDKAIRELEACLKYDKK
jgi:hypothetical protein